MPEAVPDRYFTNDFGITTIAAKRIQRHAKTKPRDLEPRQLGCNDVRIPRQHEYTGQDYARNAQKGQSSAGASRDWFDNDGAFDAGDQSVRTGYPLR